MKSLSFQDSFFYIPTSCFHISFRCLQEAEVPGGLTSLASTRLESDTSGGRSYSSDTPPNVLEGRARCKFPSNFLQDWGSYGRK